MRITVTFKQEEKYLYDFANEDHTSAATFLKDLLLAEYNRKQRESTKDTTNQFGLFD